MVLKRHNWLLVRTRRQPYHSSRHLKQYYLESRRLPARADKATPMRRDLQQAAWGLPTGLDTGRRDPEMGFKLNILG